MGGIIGGIGALSTDSGIASGADSAIQGYDQSSLGLVSPWTDQSQGTLNNINSAMGTNGAAGATANEAENEQLGATRIANGTDAYLSNNVGANFQESPGYAFAVNQSNANIQNSASANAGLLTGATAMQEEQNSTNLANQNYYQYVTNNQQAMATDYSQRNQQLQNEFTESGQNLTAAGQGISANNAATSATAGVANAEMGAATNAWGQIGGGIGSLFGVAGAA